MVKHVCDHYDGNKSIKMCNSSCIVNPGWHLLVKLCGWMWLQVRWCLHTDQVCSCELVEGVILRHLTTAIVFNTFQIRTRVKTPNIETIDVQNEVLVLYTTYCFTLWTFKLAMVQDWYRHPVSVLIWAPRTRPSFQNVSIHTFHLCMWICMTVSWNVWFALQ